MKIYLVGGAVRDKLLGLPIKEKDFVVTGATVADMLALNYQQVGKEFPVFLHPVTRDEYALARMERKVSPGYKGFSFDSSPIVTLEEDLLRRDLTINAMAMDLESEQIIDPYHGQQDLERKILRHVSSAFAEDPVRILRIGRFWARFAGFGFTIAPETLNLMKDMVKAGEVNALVAERVWKELERALNEPHPEKFFQALADCDALPILFPHLLLAGPGMNALRSAQPVSSEAAIRFAILLHAMPEDGAALTTKEVIADLCNRYRVPNYCQELAKLVAAHHVTALAAQTLSANDLLSLFSALDIFRREERFQDFLICCQAIALSQGLAFHTQWLQEAAIVAKGYDVQELIKQGLVGQDLAIAIKENRRVIIEAWLKQ